MTSFRITGVVSLLLLFFGGTANCGTIFTDRALFESALATFTIETFEQSPLVGTSASGAVPSIVFNDFTVSTTPTATKLLDAPAFGAINTTPGGQKYLYIDTDIGSSGYSAFFALDVAGDAFGFDYSGGNNASNVNTVSLDGQVLTAPNSARDAGSFFGYIADPGNTFSSVSVSASTNSAAGIDQVTLRATGNPPTVPEPTTFTMWALAFTMGGVLARKRRRVR